MTIQEAYKNCTILLKKDFIENPALEARVLLFYVLDIDQNEFYLIKDDKIISKKEWNNLNKLIKKRLHGESAACLIKKKYFYDSEFFVDKSVLIPRPETELLIDIIFERIDKYKKLTILDVGTGCGNIAIILAKYFSLSNIDALDISKKCLKVASKNIKKNNIPEKKINLIYKDIFHFSTSKKYDIIVSNPPYIQTDDAKKLVKKRIISDPLISLDGGKNGLNFYHRLKIFTENNLIKNGWIFMEHGIMQREKIIKIFKHRNFNISVYDDLAKIDRVIAIQHRG
ncbi:MAG: peptide chain release factor N(5)-glutamine methyltransferase [Spirochaetes bacterium]|nr:peptide chain release factor N(5)-glutamine methyltransferase [Spirochaetota bacterium]